MSHSVPGLVDLFGFDLLNLNTVYGQNTITFELDGDDEDLGKLKTAAQNSSIALHSSIEAISDLMMNIEMHCPNEVDSYIKVNALSHISDLSEILNIATDALWRLNRATTKQQAQKNPEL